MKRIRFSSSWLRSPWVLACLVVLALPLLPACGAPASLTPGAWEVLQQAPQLELLALDPDVHRDPRAGGTGPALAAWQAAAAEADGIHGCVRVEEAGARHALLAALEAALAAPGTPAECYDPRHALRARHGGRCVVLHLCFACGAAVLLEEGVAEPLRVDLGDPAGLQARLDALLDAARVPRDRGPWQARATAQGAPGPAAAWQQAEVVEVLGLDPEAWRDAGVAPAGTTPDLRARLAHSVRQRVVLQRPAARQAFLAQLRAGHDLDADFAAGWAPRQALRVRHAAGEALVLLDLDAGWALWTLEADGMPVPFSDPGGLASRLHLVLEAAGDAAGQDVLLEAGAGAQLVRALRALTGRSLLQCKQLAARAPVVVLESLAAGEAAPAQASLVAAGARVTLRPTGRPPTRSLPRQDVRVLSLGDTPARVVGVLARARGESPEATLELLQALPAVALRAASPGAAQALVVQVLLAGGAAEAVPSDASGAR
ncbi:MAG: ribosomal protein L7/L12 [Planctomycetia bacterium]